MSERQDFIDTLILLLTSMDQKIGALNPALRHTDAGKTHMQAGFEDSIVHDSEAIEAMNTVVRMVESDDSGLEMITSKILKGLETLQDPEFNKEVEEYFLKSSKIVDKINLDDGCEFLLENDFDQALEELDLDDEEVHSITEDIPFYRQET